MAQRPAEVLPCSACVAAPVLGHGALNQHGGKVPASRGKLHAVQEWPQACHGAIVVMAVQGQAAGGQLRHDVDLPHRSAAGPRFGRQLLRAGDGCFGQVDLALLQLPA